MSIDISQMHKKLLVVVADILHVLWVRMSSLKVNGAPLYGPVDWSTSSLDVYILLDSVSADSAYALTLI